MLASLRGVASAPLQPGGPATSVSRNAAPVWASLAHLVSRNPLNPFVQQSDVCILGLIAGSGARSTGEIYALMRRKSTRSPSPG
jgi:hypothetical protein